MKPESEFDQLKQELDRKGFPVIPKPDITSEMLDIPYANFSEISSDDIGKFRGRYAGVIAYVSVQVGLFEFYYLKAKSIYEDARSAALEKASITASARTKVTELKAAAECDQTVVEARKDVGENERALKVALRLLEGYKTIFDALSREIARRKGSNFAENCGTMGDPW
jgi:hypothetical protein